MGARASQRAARTFAVVFALTGAACAGVLGIDNPTVVGASDAGDAGVDVSNAADADAAGGHLRVFVTRATFAASFKAGHTTATSAADAQCALAATGLGGSFKAWLSEEGVGAAVDRLGNGPWYAMDGTLLFDSHGSLTDIPKAGISLDEKGNPIGFGEIVWTATTNGRLASACHNMCNDWLTASVGGDYGGSAGLAHSQHQWTDKNAPPDGDACYDGGPCALGNGCSSACNAMAHLYCFEQD